MALLAGGSFTGTHSSTSVLPPVVSVVVALEGAGCDVLADEWEGTVLWIARSPYRIHHRRKNTIGVVLTIVATNGTSCVDKRIIVSDEFNVNAILFMTWKDGRWIATKGEVLHDVRD